MSTTMHPSVQPALRYATPNPSIFARFSRWTEAQESNRFLWLALALVGHGCVLTPLTILLVVALTGMNLVLFLSALGAMALALIVNLAAQPTKVTIPFFFASVFIDLVVIGAAVGMGVS